MTLLKQVNRDLTGDTLSEKEMEGEKLLRQTIEVLRSHGYTKNHPWMIKFVTFQNNFDNSQDNDCE